MILLAENFSPLLRLLVMVPLVLVVIGRVAVIFLRQRAGQRPWWGLAIGLLSLFVGVVMLIMFLTIRGGAPPFCFALAAIPILVGLRCLLAWNKQPPGEPPPIDPRDVF